MVTLVTLKLTRTQEGLRTPKRTVKKAGAKKQNDTNKVAWLITILRETIT